MNEAPIELSNDKLHNISNLEKTVHCIETLSPENPAFLERNSLEETSLNLLDLPVEVFLHICSFLDASTLVHGLGSVCKQFYEILSDDSLWKARIGQIWQNARYPVLPPDENDELFWKQSCVSIEKHLSYWRDKKSIKEQILTDGHYGAVDTLMLMEKGQFLITGGRDRSLCCWDLRTGYETNVQYNVNPMCHEGWIWGLTSVDKTIYSCGWAKTVKSWDLNRLQLVPVRRFEIGIMGALLCITSHPGVEVLATGSHCRTVILFDPRVGRPPIVKYRTHRGPVLRLAMNENYVLSASEDKTVVVWDQRARRIMRTIEISKDSYPMSIVVEKGIAHVGDSSGNLHLLDPKKDFEIVKSFQGLHAKGIKDLCSTPGGLITCSLDNTVKLFGPTDPPQLIGTLLGSVCEIACMDYANGVLAISGSHVQIWRPYSGEETENFIH